MNRHSPAAAVFRRAPWRIYGELVSVATSAERPGERNISRLQHINLCSGVNP